MDIILVIIFSIVAILIYSLYLSISARAIRKSIGVPTGEIKYADGARIIKSKVFYSSKYQLKGKPDMIILQDNQFIPVEHKPSAEKIYNSYIMQLMVYCLLVEEAYGVTPDYGVLVLKNGKKEKLDFTENVKKELLNILNDMREILNNEKVLVAPIGQRKCSSCGYEKLCEKIKL